MYIQNPSHSYITPTRICIRIGFPQASTGGGRRFHFRVADDSTGSKPCGQTCWRHDPVPCSMATDADEWSLRGACTEFAWQRLMQ